jgi:hypothetical protein
MSVDPKKGGGGGGGSISGTLVNSSILTQGAQKATLGALDTTTTVTEISRKSMNASQVVSTAATTFTVSVSATITTTASETPITSLTPASQDEIHLLRDSIIIGSVLGGLTILLLFAFVLIYCFYKRRRRQRQHDYSPPFTALAPPRQSGLSPLTVGSSPIQPEQPQETSLSTGPGIQITEHTQRFSQGSAQQQPSLDTESVSSNQNLPAILLQPTSPVPFDVPAGRPRAQSRLYHDILREETENDVTQRRNRLDAPGPSTLRPLSGISDISDMENGPVPPSGENERGGRRLTLTRASSGVFPHD